MNSSYYLFYKPFGILSQFTNEGGRKGIGSLELDLPKDVYPVGRLDHDSEGLLLLTNDKKVNNLLLDPTNKHSRSYLVQVEKEIDEEAIKALTAGLDITIKGKPYRTLPCEAKVIYEPNVPERTPPIRFRKNVPTSWIKISLIEGKNRQVRKMTAKVGYPTLRMIRVSISSIQIDNLQPGDIRELTRGEVYSSLQSND